MLHSKGTTVLREIKDFFTTSEKASLTILDLIRSLKLSSRKFGIGSTFTITLPFTGGKED